MRAYAIRGGKEGKERLNLLARAMPMKNPSGFTCDRNTPHRAALDSILPYVTLSSAKKSS